MVNPTSTPFSILLEFYLIFSFSGGVKRVGNGLKLIHEKFKPTSGEREIYQADFRQAVEYNPEVEQYLSKAQEVFLIFFLGKNFKKN